MNPKSRGWLVSGSALVAFVGAIVTVIYVFQPWRSCDYEDTAMGCAMFPADAIVMMVALMVTVAAVIVFLFTLLRAKDRSAADNETLS